jgi:glycerol transport system permease protein
MRRRFTVVPVIFTLLLMVPFYWLVVMSFKSNQEIASGLTLLPQEPTLANYRLILGQAAWYNGYINAAIYALINVAISIAVALPAAFAFSRYRFFAQRPLFFMFVMFWMMPAPILLVPFVQIFSDLGLIDTYIAVAVAHCFFNVPLAIWILEGFITAIPREMDDSARIDGYTLPAYFRRILLPQMLPGVAVTAFFCFMFSWVEFLLSNALTTVHAKPIGSIMTRAGGVLSADISLLAAASVIGFLPGLALIMVLKNHLARGVAMRRLV